MSMILKSTDGTEFELDLIHDRLENIQDGENDTYPIISFSVSTQNESLEETAPCINLYELRTLAEWLEAVGAHTPELDAVELLEPNLSFSLHTEHNDDVVMRIGFHLENRPDWAVIDAPTDEAAAIHLRLGRDECRTAAEQLREMIAAGDADSAAT